MKDRLAPADSLIYRKVLIRVVGTSEVHIMRVMLECYHVYVYYVCDT